MDAKKFPEFAEKYKETFGEDVVFDDVYLFIDNKKDYVIAQSQVVHGTPNYNEQSDTYNTDHKCVLFAVEFKDGKMYGSGSRIEYCKKQVHHKEDDSDFLIKEEDIIKFEDKDTGYTYQRNRAKSPNYSPDERELSQIVSELKKERLTHIINKDKRKKSSKAIKLIERMHAPLFNMVWTKLNDRELEETLHPEIVIEKARKQRVERFGELRKLVIQKREKLAKAKAKQQAKELAKQQKVKSR